MCWGLWTITDGTFLRPTGVADAPVKADKAIDPKPVQTNRKDVDMSANLRTPIAIYVLFYNNKIELVTFMIYSIKKESNWLALR